MLAREKYPEITSDKYETVQVLIEIEIAKKKKTKRKIYQRCSLIFGRGRK